MDRDGIVEWRRRGGAGRMGEEVGGGRGGILCLVFPSSFPFNLLNLFKVFFILNEGVCI